VRLFPRGRSAEVRCSHHHAQILFLFWGGGLGPTIGVACFSRRLELTHLLEVSFASQCLFPFSLIRWTVTVRWRGRRPLSPFLGLRGCSQLLESSLSPYASPLRELTRQLFFRTSRSASLFRAPFFRRRKLLLSRLWVPDRRLLAALQIMIPRFALVASALCLSNRQPFLL